MLRLFWPYLVVYVVLTVLGIRESFTDGPRPLPLAVVEIVSAVLSVVGMLLYRLSDDVRKLATAWKFVFAFLVAEFVITSIVDFMEIAGEQELLPALVIVVVAILMPVVIPAYLMNLKLALGQGRGTKLWL